MPEARTDLFLSYDQETHNVSEPVGEVSKEFNITAKRRIAESVDVTISIGYGRIENPGNVTSPALNVNAVESEVRYWF